MTHPSRYLPIKAQKPMRGSLLNRSHPLARGLIAAVIFNEGSGGKIIDLSGNHPDITNYNGYEWVATPYGFGMSLLAGSSQYFGFGATPLNSVPRASIAIRAYRSSASNLISVGASLSNNNRFKINHWDSGLLYFSVANGEFSYGGVADTTFGWQSYALAYNGDESVAVDRVRGYKNGNQLSLSMTGTYPIYLGSDVGEIQVGREQATYTTAIYDYVYIYLRALTSSEVAWLHREPYCMF